MAFRIKTVLEDYEYRGIKTGEGKNGIWMSLVLEDEDSFQLEVSVPSNFQADVYSLGLKKGDLVNVPAVASAGFSNNKAYSFVQLTALPTLVAPAFGADF